MMNILSLGAGVQSSTMALMAAKGELTPMPDCAIFADTGAEPKHVYEYLDYVEANVPFPVHRVMEGNGLERKIIDSINFGKLRGGAPFFIEDGGMAGRLCTREYKVMPIEKKIRRLIGLKKGQRGPKEIAVSQWIGISMDEGHRMKPNRTKWIKNIFPLIDKRIHRYHCLNWIKNNKHPMPKKSACYFCPYSSDTQWQDLKNNDAESFNKALEMDEFIRDGIGQRKLYLHRDRRPLKDIDLDPDKDQVDMFGNECEGMCGL